MLTTLLPTDIDHIANSESDFSRSVPLASFLSRERHSHLVNLQVPQTAPPAQKRHDRSRFDSANPVADIFTPDAVVRRTVISDAITAEIVQATSDRRREFRFRAPQHLLVVCEQGARRDGETFVEGLPRSTLRDFARKLVFVPAGREYREWQEPTTAAQLMHLYFDPAKMRSFFDADTADISFAAKLFFEDATILATALKLKRALECSTSGNRLYLEALGVVLGARTDPPQSRNTAKRTSASWRTRALAAADRHGVHRRKPRRNDTARHSRAARSPEPVLLSVGPSSSPSACRRIDITRGAGSNTPRAFWRSGRIR